MTKKSSLVQGKRLAITFEAGGGLSLLIRIRNCRTYSNDIVFARSFKKARETNAKLGGSRSLRGPCYEVCVFALVQNRRTGETRSTWDLAYYFYSILSLVVLFVVDLLLASSSSNERER